MLMAATNRTNRETGLLWRQLPVRNAASDLSAIPADQQPDMMPHRLIATADSLQATVSLIAPAEGEMRFIASSPAITT